VHNCPGVQCSAWSCCSSAERSELDAVLQRPRIAHFNMQIVQECLLRSISSLSRHPVLSSARSRTVMCRPSVLLACSQYPAPLVHLLKFQLAHAPAISTLWCYLQNGQVVNDSCSSVFVPAVSIYDTAVESSQEGTPRSQWDLRRRSFIDTCSQMDDLVKLVRAFMHPLHASDCHR
jgi:hypothetical protein